MHLTRTSASEQRRWSTDGADGRSAGDTIAGTSFLGAEFEEISRFLYLRAFCKGKRILYVDAEVPNGAFDLRMAEQYLHRAQVTCLLIDDQCLGSDCHNEASKGCAAAGLDYERESSNLWGPLNSQRPLPETLSGQIHRSVSLLFPIVSFRAIISRRRTSRRTIGWLGGLRDVSQFSACEVEST